jgi:hypothetical protein
MGPASLCPTDGMRERDPANNDARHGRASSCSEVCVVFVDQKPQKQ